MPRISPELLAQVPPLAEPAALDTMDDLQAEWQRVHRAHFRRQLMRGEYNLLMYGLQSGAAITRTREELRNAKAELAQRDRIAEALEQRRGDPHVSGHALDYATADDGDAALSAVAAQIEEDV